MIDLLNPLADPPARILSSFFAQRPFPPGHSKHPWGSTWSELFALAGWKEHEKGDPESLLWQCLNCAAEMLRIEEFAQDIGSILPLPFSGADQTKDGEKSAADISNDPHLMVISLVEAEHPRSAEMQRLAAALKEIPEVLFIPIRGLVLLYGRRSDEYSRRRRAG